MAGSTLSNIGSMSHGGAYRKSAASQLQYMELLKPLIVEELRGRDNAVILDLGAADGGNSLTTLSAVKDVVKRVQWGLVDLPSNDWVEARKVLGQIAESVAPAGSGSLEPSESLRLEAPKLAGVEVTLLPASHFSRLAMTESVDVFVSGTALHYMSIKLPVNLFERGFVILDQSVLFDQKAVIGCQASTAIMEQAAFDWLLFLQYRGQELVPGGCMYLAVPARRVAIEPTMGFKAAWQVLYNTISDAVAKGFVKAEAAAGFYLPAVSRTEEEFRKPFNDASVPNLCLESVELIDMESPYWSQAEGDLDKFADLYTKGTLAWSEPFLTKNFGADFIALYRAALKDAVVGDPDAFRRDFLEALLVIRKAK